MTLVAAGFLVAGSRLGFLVAGSRLGYVRFGAPEMLDAAPPAVLSANACYGGPTGELTAVTLHSRLPRLDPEEPK